MKFFFNKHVLKPLKHGNNEVNFLSKPYKLVSRSLMGKKILQYWKHKRKNCRNFLYEVEKRNNAINMT